jgi:nucleotide-binding universal stress UspA family protein
VGAELIGIEKIVGAFLAGLAVNDAVGESPVKEKVVFVGSVLFIPIFFVNLGLLIDLPAFISSIASIWLTLMIVGGLIASKFLAALLAKLVYRYNWQEFLTMWSLSLPQVGATLAAALVGYRAGILSEAVLNSVIVLMLVTATLGPLITARSAKKLALAEPDNASNFAPEGLGYEPGSQSHPFTVVVPVYNPRTQRYLMELAALLAKHEGGRVVPLAITLGHTNMDAPRLKAALSRGQELLQKATELSQEYGITAEPLLRIDDSVAQGVNRASREQNASLVVMGWSRRTGLRARLFGNVIDEVLWGSHCPVAVTRLLDSPRNTHRILVPIDSLNQQAVRKVRFAHILAETNQAQVTLLHVCDRRTSPPRRAWIESQIALMVSKWVPKHSFEIRILPEDDVVRAVVRTSQDFDLVILRSQRYRTEGGVAISDVTTQVVHQLKCSIIVLGEPHYGA